MEKKKSIYFGILIILLGISLLLDGLGVFDNIKIFESITAFEIVIGLILAGIFVNGVMHIRFGQIFFSLAFIGIVFDAELGITAVTPWIILIVALFLTIGMHIIFDGKKLKNHIYGYNKGDFISDVSGGNLDGENLFYKVSFGDATKYAVSKEFKTGLFECYFGDLDVYFNDTIIKGDTATITVNVKFGDMTLYIPRSWNVESNVNSTFGDVEYSGIREDTNEPKKLIIQGDVNFGDLEIILI